MEADVRAGEAGIRMTWIKQGRIFNLEPAANRSTHTQVPTPYVMPDGNIRVYYACRNNGKAFIAYFDLANDLKTILKVHEQPVFEHGAPGMFDADGVMPSCVIENNDQLWMYYTGWSELKNTARYQNEIGIAVSKDGGETFERVFWGPVMGRTRSEPGLAVMPFVRRWNNTNVLDMLYQSGTGWHLIDGKYEPTYVIKYALSGNGIDWDRKSEACVMPCNPLEAFSRPSVIKDTKDDDVYKMWYCFRDSKNYRGGRGSYRIGYADSQDDRSFIRKDYEAGIGLGETGEWDSEMLCYPYVFELEDKRIMLYNGNLFGQTGIGLAIWE